LCRYVLQEAADVDDVRDDEAEGELSEEETAGARDSTADEVSVLIILFVSVICMKRSSILCCRISRRSIAAAACGRFAAESFAGRRYRSIGDVPLV